MSYINEIIRVNYKCNWKCKFCNVLKTNNYWPEDVTDKEVVYKILLLKKKYSLDERKNLILSFSWGEPTLNKNLLSYIKLAKKVWVWFVEIQTNWTTLFKNKEYINDLIDAWLDEIFLAQHSWNEKVNRELWSYFDINDFVSWVDYIKNHDLNKKIVINLNIVITKINLFSIYDYITFLLKIWFLDITPPRIRGYVNPLKYKISFWFCQPNWYALLNKEEVLLDFNDSQVEEIWKIFKLCEENAIYPDLHFTSPPICILNYQSYNLEYKRLRKLEKDKKWWLVNNSNLESYKWLWKEKTKIEECSKCKYNNYCLWFYKNWLDFVWIDYAREKLNKFFR